MTRAAAKRRILEMLAIELKRDDDALNRAHPEPEKLDEFGPEYDRWDAARKELVDEFERRSKRTG